MTFRATLCRMMAPLRAILAAVFVLLAVALGPALSATWFVGPTGTPKGDGSEAAPFASIGAAFASGKVVGGDTLLLLDGAYGAIRITGVRPTAAVSIRPVNSRRAVFDRIELYESSNLVFSRLTITWTQTPARWNNLFLAQWGTSNIVLTDSTLKAHPSSSSFRFWTQEQWLERTSITGINLNGSGHQALRNTLTGVGFGIQTNGSDILVERNIINGFSGDGLRANGDRITMRANQVRNCVQVDGNHADGFQSFNLRADKRPMDGIVLERNVIIESTYATPMPLRCKLQGFGLFDGMWSNLRIENNLVVVSAYHGIAVAGVTGVVIANNTVTLPPGVAFSRTTKPWIMVENHKDGRASSGIVIANNVSVGGVLGRGGAGVNNSVVTDGAAFVDPARFDFRPRPGSALADSADPALAPAVDLLGVPRKGAPDRGAYEAEGRWLRVN